MPMLLFNIERWLFYSSSSTIMVSVLILLKSSIYFFNLGYSEHILTLSFYLLIAKSYSEFLN
jgi:hypothetical protein